MSAITGPLGPGVRPLARLLAGCTGVAVSAADGGRATATVPHGTVVPMTTMTLREFRDGAGRVLETVERTHEPVIITKYERPVAVLIGIDEWEELEAFRDHKDSAAIARSRAEGQFVPLSEALESLGVDPREVEALLADRAAGEAA